LAISIVMGYHFNVPGFEAGYLGVDMFFVLSGYLITGNILKEIDHNNYSLSNFWSRRVFRLAPALFFLLFATVVWNNGWNENDLVQEDLEKSLIPCIFYYANWFFIYDLEYFGVNLYSNGLLHIWSLSIEEQFYMFWPFLIYLCVKLGKDKSKQFILVIGSIILIYSVISFLYF
jgi:peptidoglycan/LPS O-acetylase OafA/YrhL